MARRKPFERRVWDAYRKHRQTEETASEAALEAEENEEHQEREAEQAEEHRRREAE
jgi:hypothetical protein